MAKKGIDKKKIVLAALGVGAVGTLAFFAIQKVRANDSGNDPAGSSDIKAPTAPKKKIISLAKKKNKALPASVGNKSSSAVITASYEPFVPKDIAGSLKDAGESKDLSKVISLLQKMKNRADYTLVNNEYEHLRYWGNKSIVTDFLTNFFSDETQRQKIRNEFLRMGLVQDKATGKWSIPQNLTGFKTYTDIITLTATYVVDGKGNRIPVKKNTILGEQISAGNGMTRFKAMDGSINSVPTQAVRKA